MRNPYTDSTDVPRLDVLAIAAHPDDVEQTCGGSLIRMAEAGYRTGVFAFAGLDRKPCKSASLSVTGTATEIAMQRSPAEP